MDTDNKRSRRLYQCDLFISKRNRWAREVEGRDDFYHLFFYHLLTSTLNEIKVKFIIWISWNILSIIINYIELCPTSVTVNEDQN